MEAVQSRVNGLKYYEIWSRQLEHGKAVALFNRSENAGPVTLKLADVGVKSGAHAKDVWSGKDVTLKDGYTANVAAHGVVLLKVD